MVAQFSTGAAPILGLAILLIILAALIHEIRRFARSPRLVTFVGLMLLALASAVAGRVTWGVSPMGDSALLRAHTRLALPPWPSNLYYYDNAESYVIAHMLINPVQARAFPTGTHLLLDSGSADEVRHWFDRNDLRFDYRAPRRDATLRHFCACSAGWSSSTVFDSVHGDLWIVLQYTDMSGDEPGCSC